MEFELVPHPTFPTAAVERVNVFVDLEGSNLLLDFTIHGDIQRISLPGGGSLQRRDELWRSTCFEAFIRPGQGSPYFELNFSPSSDWAAYRFDNYRGGMSPAPIEVVEKLSVLEATRLYELVAEFDLTPVPVLSVDAAWRLGLSAIIEEKDGTKSYWALAHPEGPPDFHHDACFAATLPLIDPE